MKLVNWLGHLALIVLLVVIFFLLRRGQNVPLEVQYLYVLLAGLLVVARTGMLIFSKRR